MLNLAHLNVLYTTDMFLIRNLMQSEKRFNEQLRILAEMKSDIVSLNEVTEEYKKIVLDTEIIKGLYPYTTTLLKGAFHQVQVLSRLPFEIIFQSSRRLFLLFKYNGFDFLLITAHFRANEENSLIRLNEFKDINKKLEEFENSGNTCLVSAIQSRNILLVGDLNLHLKYEDKFILNEEFLDVWNILNPHDDGFTWDPLRNKYIQKFLLFDNRRMRLDRVLYKQNSLNLSFKSISIFCEKHIKQNRWLFPSDHFGLFTSFNLTRDGWKPEKYEIKSEIKGTGFRSINKIIFLRITFLIILITVLIFGIKCLKCIIYLL